MSNTINNVKDVGTVIAKMAAGMLADKLQFVKSIDKEPASSFGQVNGYNVGDTININKPARFIPSSTADITSTIQDVKEEKVSMALDIRSVVPIALTSAEIQNTLALKDWSNRILDPAVSSIAQNVESTVAIRAKNGFTNFAGTAGSTNFNTATMLSARTALMKSLVPQDGNLFALLDSTSMASAVDNRKGLFQSSEAIKKQYQEGYVGYADGFTYLENNLVPRHTNGADVAFSVEASVVTIANGMSTLGVDGVTSGATIKAGTKFTIPTCYKVHPITKATLPELQVFTVTADVTEVSGNSVTLAISPSIYYTTTDPRQNVSAAPVDEDACTVVTGLASTTYTHNLFYHKQACRFASVPLVKPDGLDMAGQETVDGITIRVLRGFDIRTDQLIMRLDFLGGFSVVRPEWGGVITS
jgi:hypothetical protein